MPDETRAARHIQKVNHHHVPMLDSHARGRDVHDALVESSYAIAGALAAYHRSIRAP